MIYIDKFIHFGSYHMNRFLFIYVSWSTVEHKILDVVVPKNWIVVSMIFQKA